MSSTVSGYEPVDHPAHYQVGGVEVIDLVERMPFCRGNAIKYLARAGAKPGVDEVEDLRKALWYVERELARLTANEPATEPGTVAVPAPKPAGRAGVWSAWRRWRASRWEKLDRLLLEEWHRYRR